MTKKEFIKLVEEMNTALEGYRTAEDNSPEQHEFCNQYRKLFIEVDDAKKSNSKFRNLDIGAETQVIEKREDIVILENTSTQLKFAYEKEFKNYNIWETSSYGVITITKLGPGVFGFNKEGWNIMQGEISKMDILDIRQVKIKTGTYKISSKIIKLK